MSNSKVSKPQATKKNPLAIWARIQTMTSAFFMALGGVVSLWYPDTLLAIAMLTVPVIVIAMEYPLFKNTPDLYLVRALIYMGLAYPALLQAPTHPAACFFICSSLTYLSAVVFPAK